MEVLSCRASPYVLPANPFSLRTHVFCFHTQDNAMPPYPITTLQDQLSASPANSSSANTPSIPVVCAWPVSGQYGAGSRILFYVLIAACLIARKNEWIRNACLAGALLFPAIAALHAITLAALHSPGKLYSDKVATPLSSVSYDQQMLWTWTYMGPSSSVLWASSLLHSRQEFPGHTSTTQAATSSSCGLA